MPTCSFCHEEGHLIQNCNSQMIEVYDNCIKYNAAYDFYLGLQTTYLKLYLSSLKLNILRAVGYYHNFLLKKNPCTYYCGSYVTYKEFIQQFIVHYSLIPYNKHVELINSLSHGKIMVYSHNICDLLIRNNITTNWNPYSISTILLSTRIFPIQINVISNQDTREQYDDCSICYNNIVSDTYCKLSCDHYFCASCVLQYVKGLYLSNRDHITCPLCRGEITEITLSQSNYRQYTEMISTIKNRRILNDDSDSQLEYTEPFELHIQYIPTLIIFHPYLEKIRNAVYVVVRMYVIIVYYEFIFRFIHYLFKNASSYHNQDMLQI